MLREVVLAALVRKLEIKKKIAPRPQVVLALATGKRASVCDRDAMSKHFADNGWRLFDEDWIRTELRSVVSDGYENDMALVVTKLLMKDDSDD